MPSPSPTFFNQIGYTFKDPALLKLALTHSSVEDTELSNQRLEFLGDAVIGLVVAESLYDTHPDVEEGPLDHMRAYIVRGASLVRCARQIGLENELLIGTAHREHRSDPSDGMLEDAFEALVGAIFIDGQITAAKDFIHRTMVDLFMEASSATNHRNPKGLLQEWTQQEYNGQTPVYVELPTSGPDHARIYAAAVKFQGKELGRGTGSSKKVAEIAAAKAALKKIRAI